MTTDLILRVEEQQQHHVPNALYVKPPESDFVYVLYPLRPFPRSVFHIFRYILPLTRVFHTDVSERCMVNRLINFVSLPHVVCVIFTLNQLFYILV